MNLRNASLVLSTLSFAVIACGGQAPVSSTNSADSTDDGGTVGTAAPQEGDACSTNDDCASGATPLTCIADPTDGSQTCELCAVTAPVVAAVCGGDASEIQFANDGTCGVQSCSGSDDGDDKAECRIFENCPSGQHWDAAQCACADGSPSSKACGDVLNCGRNKTWNDVTCKCVRKPSCDSQGGACVSYGKHTCDGVVIEGYCANDGVCCNEFWGGN